MTAARKRSAVDEAADEVPPCYVSPRIIEVVRQILGERIDLDPASTAAHNGHARARVFYDGTGASWPGLKAAWPKEARVWVHVPRGRRRRRLRPARPDPTPRRAPRSWC